MDATALAAPGCRHSVPTGVARPAAAPGSAGGRVGPAIPAPGGTPFSLLFAYVLFTRVCPLQVASQDPFYPLSYCCKNGFSCIIHDLSIPGNIRCTRRGGESRPHSAQFPRDLQQLAPPPASLGKNMDSFPNL